MAGGHSTAAAGADSDIGHPARQRDGYGCGSSLHNLSDCLDSIIDKSPTKQEPWEVVFTNSAAAHATCTNILLNYITFF